MVDYVLIFTIMASILMAAFILWYFNLHYNDIQNYHFLFGSKLDEFCKTKGFSYALASYIDENYIQTADCCIDKNCKRFQVNYKER